MAWFLGFVGLGRTDVRGVGVVRGAGLGLFARLGALPGSCAAVEFEAPGVAADPCGVLAEPLRAGFVDAVRVFRTMCGVPLRVVLALVRAAGTALPGADGGTTNDGELPGGVGLCECPCECVA